MSGVSIGWKKGLGVERGAAGGTWEAVRGFYGVERGSGGRGRHCVGGLRRGKGGFMGWKGSLGGSWGVLEGEVRSAVSKGLKEGLGGKGMNRVSKRQKRRLGETGGVGRRSQGSGGLVLVRKGVQLGRLGDKMLLY